VAGAVAAKVTVLAPAGTVAEAGTETFELLLETDTTAPPASAAMSRVAVQVLDDPGARVVGVQAREDSVGSGTSVRVKVFETPCQAAVSTAGVLVATRTAVAVKAAVVDPARTVTDAGAVSFVLLLETATTAPPAGAIPMRVTLQEEVPGVETAAGVHANALSMAGTTVIVEVASPPPPLAVIVAAVLTVTEPACAVKVALVASAETVTEAGTVTAEWLLESPTTRPPVSAVFVRVTVHRLEDPAGTLLGTHATEETLAGDSRVSENVLAEPFRVAVTTAVVLFATTDAVTLNWALLRVWPTLTEAGTLKLALSSLTVTVRPPVGAGAVRLTVQVASPGVRIVAGAQLSPLIPMGARVRVAVAVPPPAVAEMVAVVLDVTASVVAEKPAVVAPNGTVTDGGTVADGLLLDRVTGVPSAGAALESVTVQLLDAPPIKLAGLQAREEAAAGAERVSGKVTETLFHVAVTVAVVSAATWAAAAVKVAAVAPLGTVTGVGTVRLVLSLATVTPTPAAEAGAVSVTVQEEDPGV